MFNILYIIPSVFHAEKSKCGVFRWSFVQALQRLSKCAASPAFRLDLGSDTEVRGFQSILFKAGTVWTYHAENTAAYHPARCLSHTCPPHNHTHTCLGFSVVGHRLCRPVLIQIAKIHGEYRQSTSPLKPEWRSHLK